MKQNSYIFTVNPGSTTTKCSFYRICDRQLQLAVEETIEHPDSEIIPFKSVSDQVDYREKLVREFIARNTTGDFNIAACAALGGMLTPVPSGVITVNKELVDFSLFTPVYQHASNLGAPLAYRVAQSFGIEAYIVDPVGVDELTDIARISGSPDFPRFSFVHALNIRATIRKVAKELGKNFNEMRCVAAHLGGGFSIAAFDRGKLVDNDNRMESAPFTPERAGGIPPIPLLDACFSGKYTKEQLQKKLYGQGGLFAYLGTKDVRQVVKRVQDGDAYAKLIYDAMIYQIAKEIGAMGSVLEFNLDGIIITGGLAHETYLLSELTRKVKRLGRIFVFPGGNENEALSESVMRVLLGDDQPMSWPVSNAEK